MNLPVRVHSNTHEGLVHDKNEDAYVVLPTDEDGLLLLVCDGMGGMGHGELASAIGVEQIAKHVCEGHGFPPERLRRAIRDADIHLRQELCADSRGLPGATAVLVYMLDGLGHVAWAGDSRAYLIRDQKVIERTRDHKLVNELMEAGQLTEEEAKASALAHVVTRALGGRPPSDRPVQPSSLGHPWKFAQGDTIVLCSDGLCDLVTDEELPGIIKDMTPEEAVRALIQVALERGGHDNITVIVATWDGETYVEDNAPTPAFQGRESQPDRDLRYVPAPAAFDDDRRGVTEEIDPNWQPPQVDEEDTGITSQVIFGPIDEEEDDADAPTTVDANFSLNAALKADAGRKAGILDGTPLPAPVREALEESPSWTLGAAAIVLLLVVGGLLLALT